jgi:cytochrome c biogenesis protein CcmG, thiol:disulfide interchange protein DsbE
MNLLRILPLAMLVLLSGAMLWRLAQPPQSEVNYAQYTDPMLGKPMPALNLPPLTTDGKALSTTELAGEAYLLNVFASWCAMCRVEHPQLEALSHKSGLPLYGMAWKDKPEDTRRWLERMGDIYQRIGTDREGSAAIALGLTGAPETYLVAPDGTIAALYRGALSEAVVDTRFMPIIKQWRQAEGIAYE